MEQSHLEILLKEMRSRFDLVLEGHVALDRKIDDRFDRVNERLDHHAFLIETLNRKIDGVAADLAAHRGDTEAHHGPNWQARD